MLPLVSIITPSYNSASFIVETITAIQKQTYPNWELLITDDCSTDDSVKIIEGYVRQDSRIKLFQLEKNSGAGVARNFSIRKANGRFIAFCDSDDKWMPNKLEKQVAFMLGCHCALSYSSYIMSNEHGQELRVIVCKPWISYWDLVKANGIGCLTAMYDTKYLGKVYMPDVRKRQDWGLWLIIIKKCIRAYGIKEPLAIYRKRSGSLSSSKLGLIVHNVRIYREVLHFSMWKSWGIFFFLFMPIYLTRKMKQKITK